MTSVIALVRATSQFPTDDQDQLRYVSARSGSVARSSRAAGIALRVKVARIDSSFVAVAAHDQPGRVASAQRAKEVASLADPNQVDAHAWPLEDRPDGERLITGAAVHDLCGRPRERSGLDLPDPRRPSVRSHATSSKSGASGVSRLTCTSATTLTCS